MADEETTAAPSQPENEQVEENPSAEEAPAAAVDDAPEGDADSSQQELTGSAAESTAPEQSANADEETNEKSDETAASSGGEGAADTETEEKPQADGAEGEGEGEGAGADITDDPELEAAAVKIQARARGMKDRKRVDDIKTGAGAGEDLQQQEQPSSSGEDSGEGTSASKTSAPGKLPSSIVVNVTGAGGEAGDAGSYELTVEIIDERQRKPFFGGYRHKETGIEYHHAVSQTRKQPRKDTGIVKCHRDAQTATWSTRSAQNHREASTQMRRGDLDVSEATDYFIEPRPYFDSEQWAKLRLEKTITIQCYARGMFARTRARGLRAAIADARRKTIEEEVRKREEAEERRKQEVHRRMHPSSAADFEVLYDELEMWRLGELERIRSMEGAEAEQKQAAHFALLMKEVKLVQTIDKLKSTANEAKAQQTIDNEMQSMSAPKMWKNSDGKITEVHTPYTTRARELKELYNGLKSELSVDDRLDILLHIKWTVKEFDSTLTREIVDLVDREADLLARGRSERMMDGLRKRIVKLFLEFINTPEYNPEAARFNKPLLFDGKDMDMLRTRMPKMLLSTGVITSSSAAVTASQ